MRYSKIKTIRALVTTNQAASDFEVPTIYPAIKLIVTSLKNLFSNESPVAILAILDVFQKATF